MSQLKLGTKIAYATGQAIVNAKDVPFQYFFVTFFGTVMGVPFAIVSLANLLILMVDAITDPIMGSISDNWRSEKWGRRHLFMILGILPFGLGMWLTFTPPSTLTQPALVAWMIGMAVLVRVSLTLFAIPHMALNAELTDSYEERTELSTYRALIGNIIGVILGVLAFAVFLPQTDGATDTDGLLETSGYSYLALTCGIVGMLAAAISIWGTRSEIPRINRQRLDTAPPWWSGYVEFARALGNKTFRSLTLGFTCFAIMAGLATVMTTYILNYFWGLELAQTAAVALALGAAIIPGSIITPWLARLFDKRNALLFCTLIYAAIYVVPITMRLMGLMPENGTDVLFYSLLGIYFFGQIFVIGILILSESMMADVSDEYEMVTGARQEGVLFSGVMFARKASFAIGGSLASMGLAVIAFPQQTAPADVPAGALFNLGLFFAPTILVLLLGAFFFFLGYPLTRKRHAEIQQMLARSRTTEGTPEDHDASSG
jgi:Na+/melibiose symporter-like transporter